MSEDVQPEVPSASSESPIAAVAATAHAFDMDTMSTKERQDAMFKGTLPKRIDKPAKVSVPPTEKPAAASTDASAGTEPDSESGEDEETLTPQERRKRNRNLRTEVVRLAERSKLLEAQLAESRKPAPTVPKEEAAKPTISSKRPRLNQFSGDDAIEKWEDAVIAYDEAEMDRRIEARFGKEKSSTAVAKLGDSWNSQVDTEKAAFKDYIQVADKAVVSPASLGVLKQHAQGAKILYYLGLPENQAEAKRIAEKTDIDGMSLDQIAKAINQPGMRDRFMRVQGRVEVEFDLIADKLANPPKRDVPRIISGAPEPPRKPGGNGTAISDPLKAALEKKDWETYNRLKAEQKIASMAR